MRKIFVVFIVILALGGVSTVFATPAGPDATEMALAGGGVTVIGTNADEIAAALELCAPEDGCDSASADDSMPEHYAQVDPYQIEVYEVSNAQYAAFLNALGADAHLDGCMDQQCVLTQAEAPESGLVFDGESYAPAEGADNLPVTHVSWYGAQAYCESLRRRLPTEAEWELGARGPYLGVYPWGSEFNPAFANTAASGNGGVTSVDSYPDGTSSYGLFNTAGNVAEWVLDWYAADFYASVEENTVQDNPIGPEEGDMRVVRGGSWQDAPFYVRGAQRAAQPPDAMLPTLGFRCAEGGWPPPAPPDDETLSRYEGLETGLLEDGAPYLGSPDAPVVLTEFFQFTCPHCNHFRETLHQLLPYVEAGQLLIESRPLAGSAAQFWPAVVAICAEKQQPGTYWPLQDYFFDGVNVESSFALTYDRVVQRAEIFGLDIEALEACLSDENVMAPFTANGDLANEVGLTGVPTILLNHERMLGADGNPLSGGLPLEVLQIEIDKALAQAE